MSGVLAWILVLVATFAAVWLPGVAVIKLAALLRPDGDDRSRSYSPGPAMDL
jgi:hypothetical protein